MVCCHGNAEQIETWTATIASIDYFSAGNRPSENDTQDGLDSKLQLMKNILNERLENCLHEAAIAQDLKGQFTMPLDPKFKFIREIESTKTSTWIFHRTPDEWTPRVSESTAPSDNGARTPDETLAWSPGVSESTHASDNSKLHDNGPRLWPPGVDELPCADDASSQDSGKPLMRSKIPEEKAIGRLTIPSNYCSTEPRTLQWLTSEPLPIPRHRNQRRESSPNLQETRNT